MLMCPMKPLSQPLSLSRLKSPMQLPLQPPKYRGCYGVASNSLHTTSPGRNLPALISNLPRSRIEGYPCDARLIDNSA
jgi:hypothetical protein